MVPFGATVFTSRSMLSLAFRQTFRHAVRHVSRLGTRARSHSAINTDETFAIDADENAYYSRLSEQLVTKVVDEEALHLPASTPEPASKRKVKTGPRYYLCVHQGLSCGDWIMAHPLGDLHSLHTKQDVRDFLEEIFT